MHFKAWRRGTSHKLSGSASAPPRGKFVNYYRLYMLSAPEGRFVGFEEIEAVDDVEAKRRADEFAGERPLELWCGPRKVASIAAVTQASASARAAGEPQARA
jgi:hypothetical protein